MKRWLSSPACDAGKEKKKPYKRKTLYVRHVYINLTYMIYKRYYVKFFHLTAENVIDVESPRLSLLYVFFLQCNSKIVFVVKKKVQDLDHWSVHFFLPLSYISSYIRSLVPWTSALVLINFQLECENFHADGSRNRR